MLQSKIKGLTLLAAVLLLDISSLGATPSQRGDKDKQVVKSSVDSLETELRLKASEYFYRGALEARSERYDEAFVLLRRSYGLWPESAEVAHTLGRIYAQRGNYERTIELFSKAHKSSPSERTYMESLASAYMWGNNAEAAQTVLENWLKGHPGDEDVVQYLGKAYLRSGEYDKALKIYNQLLVGETDYARYGQIVGIKVGLLEAAGMKERANQTWQDFVDKFPEHDEPKLAYIDWCLRSDQLPQGRAVLETLMGQGEGNPAVGQMRVRYAFVDKDYSLAERLLIDQMETLDADVDNLLLLWYQLLVEQKEGDKLPERYNKHLQRMIELHPEHTNSYLTYGQVLRLQERYAEAIEVVRPLQRTEPENKEVWNSLIGDAISLGNEELMTELCLEAIKYVRTDWRYYYYASLGLYTTGKMKEAEMLLDRALAEIPEIEATGRGSLLGQLGDLVGERGDTIAAIRYYEAALEHYPENAAVLNNYAYALAERGEQLDKAERMAAQGLKLQEGNANLLDTYAWVFYKRGKYSLAHLYQKKAIEADESPSGTMYEHLGDIHLSLEDTAEALEAWSKARECYTRELKEKKTERERKRLERSLVVIEKKIKQYTNKK